MIAVLLALALGADPKDCGQDKACFAAEAKACKPVKLQRRSEKELAGVRAKSSATTVVEGVTQGKCVVDYQAAVESFQVSEDAALKLGLPDAAARGAYERKMVEWSKTSPLAHLRCEVKPGELMGWLDKGLHSGAPPPFPSELLKGCTSVVCDVLPKLATGCSVATCSADELNLACPKGKPGHPCVAKRNVERPKGCVLGCNAAGDAECVK